MELGDSIGNEKSPFDLGNAGRELRGVWAFQDDILHKPGTIDGHIQVVGQTICQRLLLHASGETSDNNAHRPYLLFGGGFAVRRHRLTEVRISDTAD